MKTGLATIVGAADVEAVRLALPAVVAWAVTATSVRAAVTAQEATRRLLRRRPVRSASASRPPLPLRNNAQPLVPPLGAAQRPTATPPLASTERAARHTEDSRAYRQQRRPRLHRAV